MCIKSPVNPIVGLSYAQGKELVVGGGVAGGGGE